MSVQCVVCTCIYEVVVWPLIMCTYLQSGQTSLMWASGGGHVQCVQLLLDRGAEANHQDKVSAV